MTQQRLLVVDDDPDFCEYVRTVAEQKNYTVETIQNPLDFKELFQSFNPAVIVLDLVMPEMDGIEIIRWLASKDRPVHVVLVTGYDPRYVLMADKLAMDRSENLKISPIEKPLHVNTLVRILQQPNN
ncbi:response regulator [Pelagibius sp. Alg239-R121]|uniref:response regulator n=1 Tax=Pelagibius sp. Alg239-R121 TaxID=2993448 RepID=UPI0024A750DD|nr:response regulator [Pelagibius sp. Alg239-R121]